VKGATQETKHPSIEARRDLPDNRRPDRLPAEMADAPPAIDSEAGSHHRGTRW
jgi:hypothetical protein